VSDDTFYFDDTTDFSAVIVEDFPVDDFQVEVVLVEPQDTGDSGVTVDVDMSGIYPPADDGLCVDVGAGYVSVSFHAEVSGSGYAGISVQGEVFIA
jgi:hypothetical protein